MNSAQPRVPRWPLLLAMAMLIAALGTFLWLRGRLIDGERGVLAGTVRRFEVTRLLGRPESLSIIFGDVETLVRASENDLITRIYVTKRTLDGKEITVVPHFADLTEPSWREQGGWVRMSVGDPPVGYLYMRINNASIRAVNGAITLLSVLLIGGFAVLLVRQRGKERQLGKTLIELETRKAEVIHLERLALAGQLSANIFHDIKKPVLNIKHEVSDALAGPGLPPEKVYRVIEEQTDLFLQMLRDLGMESFVRANAQAPEWCDLAEAVDRALKLVRYEQGGIETIVNFAPGGHYLIKSHPHRLIQLFSNLALNAFQAMGERGELLITAASDSGRIRVTVEDSGPGIPLERRGEIFAPFFTTRAQSGGSGLGLYICLSIVRDNGGTLLLAEKSALGGACFVIEFPIPPDQRARA